MAIVVGIDTSCYTTSVSAVDIDENLIVDYRKILEVKKGKKGLRQSEAVFQHMNNLPNLILQLFSKINKSDALAVSVSSRPRPLEGSYMPVFTVGKNIGSVIASSLNIPLLEFSHQEGHIRAGIWSSKGPYSSEFLAIHLSGGTTEILKVKKNGINYEIEIIGSTLDISAGQLIDRIGVCLGLKFPCGSELEKMALQGKDKLKVPICVKDANISFSGAETFIKNNVSKFSPSDIAYSVQKCISETLYKVIINSVQKFGCNKVLIVGGVASNKFLKDFLVSNLAHCQLFFGSPEYSVDNSVGTAILGVDYAKANFICK